MQTRIPAQQRTVLTQDHRLALSWRLLSYLFCFVLVNLLASIAKSVLAHMDMPSLLSQSVFTLLYISGMLGLTYLYRRSLDHRSWRGIALPAINKQVLAITSGAVLALLMVALLFGLEYAAGWLQVDGSKSGTDALLFLVESLILSLSFGVCEEIAFRGYLFQNLAEASPVWVATLITGLIFGAFHLLEVGFNLPGLVYVLFILLLNVFLVLTRLLTRSIWLAISFHTVFDWMGINLGLGIVVLTDTHLLSVTRTTSVIVEDLLVTLVVLLGMLLLLAWARRSKQDISWHGKLMEDGQVQASKVAQ